MINFTRTFHQVTVKNFTVDELLATHKQKSSEYNQKGHRPKSTVSDQVYAQFLKVFDIILLRVHPGVLSSHYFLKLQLYIFSCNMPYFQVFLSKFFVLITRVSSFFQYLTMGVWTLLFILFFAAFCFCKIKFCIGKDGDDEVQHRRKHKKPLQVMTSLNGEVAQSMDQFVRRFPRKKCSLMVSRSSQTDLCVKMTTV